MTRGIPNFSGYSVFDGNVHLHETLGKGGFGRVFRGETTDLFSGEPVSTAVKVIMKEPKGSYRARQQALEQVLHLAVSSHPNVVTLRDAETLGEFALIQLDYCPGGSLKSYMEKNETAFANDDAKVKRIFGQILDAVLHCHSSGVYHRDIKPDNVLLSEDGADAFLSDFGLASSSAESADYCGSRHYKSPECLNVGITYKPYDHAANDVWALGVTLVAMLTQRLPWNAASCSDPCYRRFRQDPQWLYNALPFSPQAFALLQAIFDPDPETRLTLPELIHRVREMDTFFRQKEDPSGSPAELVIVDPDLERDGGDGMADFLERDLSLIKETIFPITQSRKKKKWREKMSTFITSPFRRLRRLSDSS